MSASTKKRKQAKLLDTHLNIFIGHDTRQPLNTLVCKKSILDNASKPVSIFVLKHRTLRDIGLFKRPWEITPAGLSIDQLDHRPFSTDFAFTRFLVPHYARYLGTRINDPCVFMDSDFVNLTDIYKILGEIKVEDKPLWCIKHDYNPSSPVKMDNQPQSSYNKKLWSSFMIFNMRRC